MTALDNALHDLVRQIVVKIDRGTTARDAFTEVFDEMRDRFAALDLEADEVLLTLRNRGLAILHKGDEFAPYNEDVVISRRRLSDLTFEGMRWGRA